MRIEIVLEIYLEILINFFEILYQPLQVIIIVVIIVLLLIMIKRYVSKSVVPAMIQEDEHPHSLKCSNMNAKNVSGNHVLLVFFICRNRLQLKGEIAESK